MTDKIMIDGVDVSECRHYKNKSCGADYLLIDVTFSDAKCRQCPNCYYKQLQRKEEELKMVLYEPSKPTPNPYIKEKDIPMIVALLEKLGYRFKEKRNKNG